MANDTIDKLEYALAFKRITTIRRGSPSLQ